MLSNCDVRMLSDRAIAAVADAALKGADFITVLDEAYIIDKNKLRREREKYKSIIGKEEAVFYKFLDRIYIDGRKDATLMIEHDAQTGKYYKKGAPRTHSSCW